MSFYLQEAILDILQLIYKELKALRKEISEKKDSPAAVPKTEETGEYCIW